MTAKALQLTIDGRLLRAHEGETVLEVARREGINIPALCYQEGMAAWGACRLCLVEIEGTDKLQTACTAPVSDGMVVQTDTPRVRARRASYLKMYLSDHNAYCEAPCTDTCPAHIDIPGYMAALAADDVVKAAEIIRKDLPFPGILGVVCSAPCEPVCRRGDVDEPIAICALHGMVADEVQPSLEPGDPTGKRVAVIDAGPAGLTAAWYLTELGHRVTLYDVNELPGGILRYGSPEQRPGEILDVELEPLWEAGVRFIGKSGLANDEAAATLLEAGFDAVILAGEAAGAAGRVGAINPHTGRAAQKGIFAVAESAGGDGSVIHRIAGGKRAALVVDAWLDGEDLAQMEETLAAFAGLPYLGQLEAAERLMPVENRLVVRSPVWLKMGINAEPAARLVVTGIADARAEAQRCLQCTCPSLGKCDLQRLG
ncbi:MAG TPA: 2Fe-2S iron-sulfur cluster-binding protein, partial [Thermoleophilia bacterium]|nr:2Fe-2S iron-sulfur cluster-binding protein [Thermoleophilia bacterium]